MIILEKSRFFDPTLVVIEDKSMFWSLHVFLTAPIRGRPKLTISILSVYLLHCTQVFRFSTVSILQHLHALLSHLSLS
jgi:hypothetical protein